ncbi:MAG TPA: galactokinase family protein [bacterium]|nr:galactokinase family protein [bacterium]
MMDFKPIDYLSDAFSQSQTAAVLRSCYGSHPVLIERQRKRFWALLKAFRERFPETREVGLLRVPGRINLMGVHVDHRGGWCNYMPVARETLFCFAPRPDDRIAAKNLSPQYPDLEFSIQDELPPSHRGHWLKFIESVVLEPGHWGNYLKAGALKLQDGFPGRPLRGMNVAVEGDIPPRSGLSSSSALVVGTVLALRDINHLPLSDGMAVEWCGEAEWYVGTRGGAGDHSALILGKRNQISHTGFKPLTVDYCPFPAGWEVLVAQSGIEAGKAMHARETFNSRIAAYEVALAVFREAHPAWKDQLALVRDISPGALETDMATLYTAFKAVPVQATPDELRRDYPQLREKLEWVVTTYGEPQEPWPLREVLLFGAAECARARLFPRLIREGNLEAAGELMYISHDGDRVSVWNGREKTCKPYRSPFTDDYLEALAEAARRHPREERLELAYQPGGYRCSVPELDRMVDRCKELEGVVGAGLTGAGLGGAVLVLVRPERAAAVMEALRELIATWHPGEPWIERCHPVAGASRVDVLFD